MSLQFGNDPAGDFIIDAAFLDITRPRDGRRELHSRFQPVTDNPAKLSLKSGAGEEVPWSGQSACL